MTGCCRHPHHSCHTETASLRFTLVSVFVKDAAIKASFCLYMGTYSLPYSYQGLGGGGGGVTIPCSSFTSDAINTCLVASCLFTHFLKMTCLHFPLTSHIPGHCNDLQKRDFCWSQTEKCVEVKSSVSCMLHIPYRPNGNKRNKRVTFLRVLKKSTLLILCQ